MIYFSVVLFFSLSFYGYSQEVKDVNYKDLWRRGPEKIYYLLPDTINPYSGNCHMNYSKTNKVAIKGEILNGYQTGEWVWMYKDGKVKRTTEYKKGMKHGKTTYYYKTGQKKSEINFFKDKNIQQVSWNEKGERISNPGFKQYKD